MGGDAQRGMVVEAAPSASLEVSEPDLLLELLIVAFDPPAQLGEFDQAAEGDVVGYGREPVLGRLRLTFGPLDQQPLFVSAGGEIVIAMAGANPNPGEAGGQPVGRALAPPDRPPCLRRQTEREVLRRDGLVVGRPFDELGRTPAARPRLRRQRRHPRTPDRGLRQDAGHVDQSESSDAGTQIRVVPYPASISTTPWGRLASQAA